ncbi:hypothetical protein FEM48_Zijuj07G0104100 [Ziziphus jujuba var. spinosa]|uniref:VPS37 C-terminal domain-containing protein n=1 Tax=Ziziphus jujuba var. spinosa TaxID=714518 RepID=A0A978V435_ZIZJJ|nr:hypothetical protein FEM48_Zijuj07G0104100 [Ziziphus jujuba var. spinosa]
MARKESMDWILTVKAHYRFSAVAVVLAMNISRRSVLRLLLLLRASAFSVILPTQRSISVVFDTTHCLTVFDMPFGIWVGMNNYGENLENEPRIMELRNQEKLHELERQKEEMLRFGSPASLLQRLQDAMNKTNEESENLHKQLFDREIELGPFVQIYKKLCTT